MIILTIFFCIIIPLTFVDNEFFYKHIYKYTSKYISNDLSRYFVLRRLAISFSQNIRYLPYFLHNVKMFRRENLPIESLFDLPYDIFIHKIFYTFVTPTCSIGIFIFRQKSFTQEAYFSSEVIQDGLTVSYGVVRDAEASYLYLDEDFHLTAREDLALQRYNVEHQSNLLLGNHRLRFISLAPDMFTSLSS